MTVLDGSFGRWFGVLAAVVVAVAVLAWFTSRRRRRAALAQAPAWDPQASDAAATSLAVEDTHSARRRYMAQVGHEIRTPIADIIATLDLLQRSALTPAQLRLVDLALSSGNALLGKVNQVLDVARIEFDRESVVVEPTDLPAQVRAGAAMHAAAAAARWIRLGMHVAPRPFPRLLTDASRIRQIVSNLVADAAGHEGGSIDVHLRARRAATAGQWLVEIEVCFGGEASNPSTVPLSFGQPDDRPNRSEDDPGGRPNGLGLWICRELATLIGGRIDTQESEADGSRYRLLLTLTQVNDAEPCDGPVFEDLQAQLQDETIPGPSQAMVPAIGSASAKVPVLLVEDDRINRFLAARLLEASGFEVDVFDDAREALAHWRRYAHPVVVTDCILAPFDGHELARSIREAERAAAPGRPRCLIVGVSASETERQRALDSGMDEFLGKPLTMQAIRRGILARLKAATTP